MNKRTFQTKDELFAYLKANKSLLTTEKKSQMKYADAVSSELLTVSVSKSEDADKAAANDLSSLDSIEVTSVINTTNILDSHGDVHLPGIWNKSVKENKQLFLIKEHRFDFDHVISDEVKAEVRTISWKELGFSKWQGDTQALVFVSKVSRGDSAGMFERYAARKVPNHSVGMRYVKIALAINSEDKAYKEEKAVWDKYIDQIINKDAAQDQGYFWAVAEAKIIEGSAVLRGSNIATPTLSVGEPSSDTRKNEPPQALTKSMFAKVAELSIINL